MRWQHLGRCARQRKKKLSRAILLLSSEMSYIYRTETRFRRIKRRNVDRCKGYRSMKHKLISIIVAAVLVGAIASLVFAQSKTARVVPPTTGKAVDARLFSLEDVRPGMKGIARTVFSG